MQRHIIIKFIYLILAIISIRITMLYFGLEFPKKKENYKKKMCGNMQYLSFESDLSLYGVKKIIIKKYLKDSNFSETSLIDSSILKISANFPPANSIKFWRIEVKPDSIDIKYDYLVSFNYNTIYYSYRIKNIKYSEQEVINGSICKCDNININGKNEYRFYLRDSISCLPLVGMQN